MLCENFAYLLCVKAEFWIEPREVTDKHASTQVQITPCLEVTMCCQSRASVCMSVYLRRYDITDHNANELKKAKKDQQARKFSAFMTIKGLAEITKRWEGLLSLAKKKMMWQMVCFHGLSLRLDDVLDCVRLDLIMYTITSIYLKNILLHINRKKCSANGQNNQTYFFAH